jgi:alcohol dehydrogenase (cytochrome c)
MTIMHGLSRCGRGPLVAGLLAALAPAGAVYAAGYPAVTSARLAAAASDNGWLMFRRDYAGNSFAPFKQIDTHNVQNLREVWSYRSHLKQGYETTPIVNGQYMFITTPKDHLIALNAVTGKVLWKYVKPMPDVGFKTVCCDVVNRGVALYRDNVYMATLDNYVVALNAMTGKVVWQRQLKPADVGYAMTLAPLILKGMVIVGESGGEYGARDFVQALNATTGAPLWRRWSTAAPGHLGGNTWPKGMYQHGGGSAWLTGTYDPLTDTLFWGIGNPAPWFAKLRPGRNLFTDSVLALQPRTGKIKWYYQYTPHDSWDYDGVNTPVITTLRYHGKEYQAIVHADRNGWFYAIDRVNGKLIYARPFTRATSVAGFKDGLPYTNHALRPTMNKQVFDCPSFLGGKNWWPISVDPLTHMAYVPTIHTCMTMQGAPTFYHPGLPYLGERFEVVHDPADHNWGALQAIDLDTGRQVWDHESVRPWDAGAMSTAGGLVFSGSARGHLYAFDARTGRVLWRSPQLSSGIIAPPSTFVIHGKQYVAIVAGWGGGTPIWGGKMVESVKNIPRGGHVYVFALR